MFTESFPIYIYMVKCLCQICFVLIVHFKITADSCTVIRNNTARSCTSFTQFPQGPYLAHLQSNITTEKLILMQSPDLIQVLYACVCVFSSVQFITCLLSCNHHPGQGYEQLYHKSPSCHPFVGTHTSLPHFSWQSLLCFPSLYNLIISRMFCKYIQYVVF